MLNCSGVMPLCCKLHTGNGAVRCEGICGILWLWGKCNWRFKGLLTDSCTSAVVNHPKGSFGILVSVAALGCGCRKGDFYLHLSAFQLFFFLQEWAMLLICLSVPPDIFWTKLREGMEMSSTPRGQAGQERPNFHLQVLSHLGAFWAVVSWEMMEERRFWTTVMQGGEVGGCRSTGN